MDERNKALLKDAIMLLVREESLRERFGRTAQEVVERNHDAGKVREAFRKQLAEAAVVL